MQIKQLKWPHFENRKSDRPIKYIIIHCFAFPIRKNLTLWNKLGIGPHYLIDQKGNISQFVAENKIAWHAGKSSWHKEVGLNAASIGIELYSPSFGQKPYPKAQIEALKELIKDIMKRHHILPQNVLGHSDVAPTRKVDPGICFPWAEMAKKGIGLWPKKMGCTKTHKHNKTLLREIGYDVTDEKAALLAFVRHFMPNLLPLEKDVQLIEKHLPKQIAQMPKADKMIRDQLICVADAYTKKH